MFGKMALSQFGFKPASVLCTRRRRLMIRFALITIAFGASPARAEMPRLFRERSITCATLAEAVNHYVALGERRAIEALESEILDWDKDVGEFSRNRRIGWVCRILFQPKGEEPLRSPYFGEPLLPRRSMPLSKWPLYPVACSGSTYFVLSEGYVLTGLREDPKDYLNYCRDKGKFRAKRLPVLTKRQALKDLEQLRQSDAWKAIKWMDSGDGFSYSYNEDRIWDLIKLQVEGMPESKNEKKKG